MFASLSCFFLCVILSVSLMKTPPRYYPFILWWKNTCPALQKETGRADAFWQLRQAQEMAAGCPWCCWVPLFCAHTRKPLFLIFKGIHARAEVQTHIVQTKKKKLLHICFLIYQKIISNEDTVLLSSSSLFCNSVSSMWNQPWHVEVAKH